MATTTTTSGTQTKEAVVARNGKHLAVLVEQLANHFHGSKTLTTTELLRLCFSLAKVIDYALSSNDTPQAAHFLPVLIKKICQLRDESEFQSALMVLMISAKNACDNNWFEEKDRQEIFALANEFSSILCYSVDLNPDPNIALAAISEITPRFFPQFKLTRLIVSFEAKPGYDVLLSSFIVKRDRPSDEEIRLYVIQSGNLETSSCISQPPIVSFLVNGKGVERRNNMAMETGPQVPTDITRMLKFGTNIIQAAGCFNGNYIIAIASTSTLRIASPILQDYTEPNTEVESDSEIMEGNLTVSLNCPISFGRIKTPVKGYQCRHPQCFDYDNFIKMNSRKPIWRCPHCNRPVCALDIRLDQKMAKILKEVDNNASRITILPDGSWDKVDDQGKNQQSNFPLGEKKDKNNNSKGDATNEIIDLMPEENDANEPMDVEDTKPTLGCQVSSTGAQVNTMQPSQPQTHILHEAQHSVSFSPEYGTLESVLPDSLRSRTGPSSSHLQQHLQHNGNLLRTPSIPRNTTQMPGSMQAPPTPLGNPSRGLGSGMLNSTNSQLPSSATVTVAVNGIFGCTRGSVPSSFVAPQQSQNLFQNWTPANRTYQPMMSVSAQRPIAPSSSTRRVAHSFRMPPPTLNSPNSLTNNTFESIPFQQHLFQPVWMPTSTQSSFRTRSQPSSMAPLAENGYGLAQSTIPEISLEQDWRLMGRRGGLTGEAHSATRNNYLVPNTLNTSNNASFIPNPNSNTGGSNTPSTLDQAGRLWYY